MIDMSDNRKIADVCAVHAERAESLILAFSAGGAVCRTGPLEIVAEQGSAEQIFPARLIFRGFCHVGPRRIWAKEF